jgi:hypothetical protein
MKINQSFFIIKLNNYRKSNEIKNLPAEKKQVYLHNYIYLLLLDICSILNYKFTDINFFYFLNRIFLEINIALNNDRKFEILFLPKSNDIIFNYED